VRVFPYRKPGDKFELVFKNLLDTLFVERMDQNEEIVVRFMNDLTFQEGRHGVDGIRSL
jgi:hypothetical protein